jgi:hypothetical protein
VVGSGLFARPLRILGIQLLVALRHPLQCLFRFGRGVIGAHRPRCGAHVLVCLDAVVPQTPVVRTTSAVAHDITVHCDSLKRELFDEKLV